jgi:voltage-gated potassium channel
MASIALRTWQVLEENDPEDRLNRWVDGALLGLILLSVLGAVLGTVGAIQARFSAPLEALERAAVLVFSAEYLARVWAAPVDPRYSGAAWGRLRYVLTPMALVDLLAVLPFYLAAVGVGLGFTDALRVFRIFRLIKALRYMPGAGILWQVARSKREELLVAAVSLAILLLAASSLMFYAEHDLQPSEFSSIPATLWWAVATVTTVGYGDVYPKTPLGRLLGSAVAILGIGFFALPTAILGSGFVEAFGRRRAPPCCPHCGREAGRADGETAGG